MVTETKKVIEPQEAKQAAKGNHAFTVLVSSLILAGIVAAIFLIPW